jgi:hypothetical protein
MTPFNATVIGGFEGRDGVIRLWVKPDGRNAEPRQVIHDAPLNEGKRVKLDGGAIVEAQ